MTLEIGIVLSILGIAFILFLIGKIRIDLIGMLILLSLSISGILTVDEVLDGFSNEAVITVFAIFIISAGLNKTGVSDNMGIIIRRFGKGDQTRLIIAIMVLVAILSSVMNNVAAASILFPAVISISAKTKIPASKLLIPLAYGSILGGMLTQIGTPPNLIVSDLLIKDGFKGFGLFDFFPIGVTALAIGVIYMAFIGRKILPDRSDKKKLRKFDLLSELNKLYHINEIIYESKISPHCKIAYKTLGDSKLGEYYGVNVAGIVRGRHVIVNPPPDTTFLPKDRVLLTGSVESLHEADESLSLGLKPSESNSLINLSREDTGILEAIIAPRSAFEGHSLSEVNFREKYGANVIGIWREGETISTGVGKVNLKIGDMLLIQGKWSKLNLLKNDPDLIVTSTTETFSHEKKKPHAFVILLLGVAATVLDILPVSIAMLSAAILMVITKILTMEQAYKSVEWKMIFLMAGILPLGTAMEKTGAASLIGSSVMSPIADIGIVPLVIAIFVITVIFCSAIPNIASAAIIGAIAIEAGVSHGFDPHILMLAVAYGASTAFITPVSQQSNMLVMGAGGYTFRDFLKVGMPLTIITGIAVTLLLILFY